MRLTLIHPCFGRRPGQRYIRSWQMEPVPAATIAGLTPPDLEVVSTTTPAMQHLMDALALERFGTAYEDYEPLVRRIAEGEPRVLTAEAVTRLAVTSGSITPRVVRIRDGFQGFASRAVVRGRRLGDVKPVALDLDGGWSEVFTSAASDPAGDGRPCTMH